MKNLIFLAFAGAMLHAQTATITDTIRTPMGGNWSGTVVVTLNNPATAQPLYAGSETLSGWSQTVTVTAGAFSITLYPNDTIVPGGTSYTARYSPTSGAGWSETWVVPTGATTIRELRSTTVPTPRTMFTPSQITQAGATLNQILRWNGATWAPATVSSGGGSGTVTSVSVTTANGVSGTVATATTTPAITLSLGAITPSSVAASGTVTGSNLSGTNTGDQTTIAGNAGTATALASNGANCSAGQFPLGVDASGAAENCTALPTTITGTANQITASGATGAVTLSFPAGGVTLPGTTTGTFSGSVTGNVTGNVTGSSGSTTGNAGTATALAANPTDCTAGQYATTIAASGDLTCAAVAYSQVSGTPTLATIATSGSASDLTTGTVGTARLGMGTADATTFLRGDGTWATPSGGGTPGGTGSELQVRGGASTFSALENSSVPNSGELLLATTPAASATRSVFGLGSAIASGSASGTVIGANYTSFSGDFVNWQTSGTNRFRVSSAGTITIGAANTYGTAGSSLSNTATVEHTNANTGAAAALRVTGSAGTGSGNFLALRATSASSAPNQVRINADQRAVMIGQTAESASVSDLSLGVFDDTAATGVTRTIIQAAANQASVNLLEVRAFDALLGNGALLYAVAADGSFRSLPSGARPTCASGIRGTYWFTQGGAGVKDALDVCVKNASDAYVWHGIH